MSWKQTFLISSQSFFESGAPAAPEEDTGSVIIVPGIGDEHAPAAAAVQT